MFFGKVMAQRIPPFLDPGAHFIPRGETALALDRIAAGRLVDLSPVLAWCALQVNAMRLQGNASPAEAVFWSLLLTLHGAAAPRPAG